jgi:hypothetical protein
MTTPVIGMFEGGGDCSSHVHGFQTAQDYLARHSIGV